MDAVGTEGWGEDAELQLDEGGEIPDFFPWKTPIPAPLAAPPDIPVSPQTDSWMPGKGSERKEWEKGRRKEEDGKWRRIWIFPLSW